MTTAPIPAWPAPPIAPGKVRVGLLAPCLVQGGAEAWMVALSRHADPSRVGWVGTAIDGIGATDPRMVAALGGRMPVAQGRGAMRALAAASDVLVTWAIDDLPGIIRGLPKPPKVVAVVHAPPESAWGQTVYARPEGVDRWVAVSELALLSLPEASRSAAPASVIWNAVDRDRLAVRRDRATMRGLWGVPDDAPVAVFLQRLSEEKDAPAAARLAAHLPGPWRVVVVGDGPVRPEMERLRREWGLDRLHLVGTDPAAGDVLHAADVFVGASDYESFGLSLAEAIVSGVPVVSTEVGLARLRPGIARVVPRGADGPTLAAAVQAARAEGPTDAAARLRPDLDPGRFGREWTDLLGSLRPAAPVPVPAPVETASAPTLRVLHARVHQVRACPHLTPPSCGCPSVAGTCAIGRGRGGSVTAQDCQDCVAASPIEGWIHVARIGPWREVLAELVTAAERAGLHRVSGRVTACFCGPTDGGDGFEALPRWIDPVELGPDLELGECPTLRRLWADAIGRPAGKTWYAHTKGVSRAGNPAVAAWRRYLAHWTLARWRDAAAALDSHDVAGVDWIEPGESWWEDYPVPGAAFLGNFWWARRDYLAGLPADRVDLSRSRWSAEWDFVGTGKPRAKVFHRSRRNLYAHEITPNEYGG